MNYVTHRLEFIVGGWSMNNALIGGVNWRQVEHE